MSLFQLLKVWHKDPLIAVYDVRDLIEELQEWVDEGFVEADIWSTLQKRVNPTLLPEQMEQESTTSFGQVKNSITAVSNNIHAFRRHEIFSDLTSWPNILSKKKER